MNTFANSWSLKFSKVLMYAASLSLLIVASDMFFPFIVGKAMFFRITTELGLLFYLIYLLAQNPREEMLNLKYIARQPIFKAIVMFTAAFLLSCLTAVNSQFAFWSNFERGEGGLQIIHYAIFFALLALIFKTKKEWFTFFTWMLATGVGASFYALGQRLKYLSGLANVPEAQNIWIGYFGDGARISGTLGNPLYLSALIIFLFFIIAVLMKENTGNKPLLDSKNELIGASVGIVLLLLLRGLFLKGFLGTLTFYSVFLGTSMFYSTMVALVFFVVATLIKTKHAVWFRLFLLIPAAFEIYIFILSESRNGMAGVVAGIIALLIYYTVRGKNIVTIKKVTVRYLSVAILAALVIFGSLFYATRSVEVCADYREQISDICLKTATGWQSVPGLYRFATENPLQGIRDRVWVWGAALSAFREKPVFGWGPENFPIPFDKYYNPNHYGLDSWFDRSHNTYLEYLTAGGIILLFAYIAIWSIFFRELIRRRKKMSVHLLGMCLAFSVAYLVQAITAFEVLPIYVMLFAFLAFALHITSEPDAAATVPTEKSPAQKFKEQNVSAANMMLIGGVAILIILSFYFANYLPYIKNTRLLQAATNPSVGDAYIEFVGDKDKKITGILEMRSSIGGQEAVQYFLLTVLSFLERNIRNPELAQNPTALKSIINEVNNVYEENEKNGFGAIGLKTLYYNAIIYTRGAEILNDTQLMAIAENKLRQGLEKAPARLEFIYALLDIAAAKRDSAMAGPLLETAKKLRPDLERNKFYEDIFSPSSTPQANTKAGTSR